MYQEYKAMKAQLMAVTKPGCPACIQSKPEIAKLKRIMPGLVQIDADKKPQLVDDLKVKSFPDFIYKEPSGTVHHMPWQGPPTAASIQKWIEGIQKGHIVSKQSPPKRVAQCAQCGAGHGIPPSVWGPGLWFTIHTVALTYPQKPTPTQKTKMQAFFKGLQPVLPCDFCKKHYAVELKTMKANVFDSRDSLFGWTVCFHNSVSRRTGSTQPRRSVAYWRDYYKRALLRTSKA